MKRIYMDHAASTPIDKKVVKAMGAYAKKNFGNPGSIHKEGIAAKEAMEAARRKTAGFFGAHADEIMFTSGGTEANNLAIQGVFEALLSGEYSDGRVRPIGDFHAITSVIEHPSVLEVFRVLEKRGLSVTYAGVDETGTVNIGEIKDALRPETVLVSVMLANNEIGTVQPIAEIAKVIRRFRKNKKMRAPQSRIPPSPLSSDPFRHAPFFHTDACQAIHALDFHLNKLGVDLLSASASKFYGPKGVGFLYAKRNTPIAPIMRGGGQEGGARPGTENSPGIAGAAMALSLVKECKSREIPRLNALREYFMEKLRQNFSNGEVNGTGEQLPHILNVSFPDFDNEELILRLDAKGIAAASRSACKSRDETVSYTVKALGDGHHPESAVRFSMGRATRKKDIDTTVKALKEIFTTIKKVQN